MKQNDSSNAINSEAETDFDFRILSTSNEFSSIGVQIDLILEIVYLRYP